MKRSDFHFRLPDELIAHFPPEERGASRLLVLDGATGAWAHRRFQELEELLRPGDLLVFNDTRVIPARLYGCKQSGGRIEILIERILDPHRALAHVRASKAPKPGATLLLQRDREHGMTAGEATVEVEGRRGELFELTFSEEVLPLLERIGHMPLPPYIDRGDAAVDRERYQTVYGRRDGAVAAPTAGLHFSAAQLQSLRQAGIGTAFVTLHVGAGTFQPVRVDDIRNHVMHREWLEVSEAVCDQVAAVRARGGRVIAVGTTSVRCLETAAASGLLQPYAGETNCFIYPGYRFRTIDGLITNFHLPESTLLMLVSALAGREAVLAAYEAAVAEHYRFFSYGDAMLVWPHPAAQAEVAPRSP